MTDASVWQAAFVATVLGEQFAQALTWAWAHHCDQWRKVSGVPYVGHLLGVTALVIDDGGSEAEAIAALLHDAVEDADDPAATEREIATRFGDDVRRIVLACSDSVERPKRPWLDRKRDFLQALDSIDAAALRVVTADKLHNSRALVADVRARGIGVFEQFNGGRDGTLWYYRALADRLAVIAPGPMIVELEHTVDELEALAGLPGEQPGPLGSDAI